MMQKFCLQCFKQASQVTGFGALPSSDNLAKGLRIARPFITYRAVYLNHVFLGHLQIKFFQ
jgi:hypothetical protein